MAPILPVGGPKAAAAEEVESETYIHVSNKHILDQIDAAGYYKTLPATEEPVKFLPDAGIAKPEPKAKRATASVTKRAPPPPPFPSRQPAAAAKPPPQPLFAPQIATSQPVAAAAAGKKTELDVSLSVMDIKNVDPMKESFSCKVRLYAMWRCDDLFAAGMDSVADKARAEGHCYSMSPAEVEDFISKCAVPAISFFNACDTEALEAPSIRVYGGTRGRTAVLWNQGFNITCREHFELNNFPFDTQNLTIELRLNDPKTWDDYRLTVNVVQFHRQAIELSEWRVMAPIVKRDCPADKASAE